MLLPKNVTFAYLFSENESAYRQKKQKKFVIWPIKILIHENKFICQKYVVPAL